MTGTSRGHRTTPYPPTAAAARSLGHRRHQRDRHGRGLRSPLLPPTVPGFRSRAQLFDQVVLDALAELEETWPEQLPAIEFAVDEVPHTPTASMISSQETMDDNGVVLSRFLSPGVDSRGRATKGRVVIYRRPVELRAHYAAELADLVLELLTEQLTRVFGEGDA